MQAAHDISCRLADVPAGYVAWLRRLWHQSGRAQNDCSGELIELMSYHSKQ